jgi:pSer/pThr/pTyr-binding forkhead associated (FHA) protein
MTNLFLVRYPESPVLVPEKGKITIGRAGANTIVLAEPRVSRFHAQIEYQYSLNAFAVSDLGSANGTSVNSQRLHALEPRSLANWDKIRIASSVFTVRLADNIVEIKKEFKELHSRVHLHATEVIEISDLKSVTQQSAISGDLEHVCTVELFQMLEHGGKTGALSLKTNIGEGIFTFKKGKVVSAIFGKESDEKAVFNVIRCTRGTFSFSTKAADISKEEKITASTTMLLMEGCRRMDEENAAAQKKKS